MKKIAIVSYGGLPVPPVRGGAVENLIQAFADNNETQNSAELTIISTPDDEAFREADKYSRTRYEYAAYGSRLSEFVTYYFNGAIRKLCPWLKLQVYPYMLNVGRILKKEKFDCIILENRPEFVPYIKKKCKSSVFLHMHNDYFDKSYYCAEKILSSADGVIAVSDYVKECIGEIDRSYDKISVLRNVVDTERFSSVSADERSALRQSLGATEDDIVFAFFGRLIEGKGVKELLLAFSRLREKHNNVRLLIVGAEWFSSENESDYIKEIKAIASKLGDSVIFSGYVDYGRIQNQYACADVVVVPSIIGEACGLVVLEAMASGRALVVSDSGGIPEHADSSCALIAQRGDQFVDRLFEAMDKLASDRELIGQMGNAGTKRSTLYDRRKYLDALLEIIGD